MEKGKRSSKCPCGSGRKYKKCCEALDHHRAVINDWMQRRKYSYRSGKCLHPECAPNPGSAIKAHTLGKSGPLDSLATEGHVYVFQHNPHKMTRDDFGLELKKIGINKASTFPGFCSKHDSSTFGFIDSLLETPTQESAFLFNYRSICHELFKKMNAVADTRFIADCSPASREVLQAHELGAIVGLNELIETKQAAEKVLLARDYKEIRYWGFEFEPCPQLVSTGQTQPTEDIYGAKLQDLSSPFPLDHLNLTITPSRRGGLAFLSWIGDLAAPRSLASSMLSLSDSELVSRFVQFALKNVENTYFSIPWWNSLSNEEKHCLKALVGTLANYQIYGDPKCDDNFPRLGWNITKKYSCL
jgi:hypothetical protein